MAKEPFTRDDAILEEGGSLPLASHVQGSERVYGEPKGPLGEALIDDPPPKIQRPADRDRDGFVGGTTRKTRGDLVGSGPEEYDRLPKPDNLDDPATKDRVDR
jgi:hypothetical protein